MIGYISSIETMGLVDGPGVRVVIFMQGCHLRCLFCHNPETWNLSGGIKMTPREVVDFILRYKNYFGDNGGVTFSGGEPLLQDKFLLETLKLCKENNINTCLDTAGVGNGKYDEILKYTDLVLFDIKGTTRKNYKYMTNVDIDESEKFIEAMNRCNSKVIVRAVIVPGINDTNEYIISLKQYIKKINKVLNVELLPYHNNAIEKYRKLGIKYRLLDTPNMDLKRLEELKKQL